ncbi:unnamed protein product [Cylicocyclus nassatus]|uniref:Uncharacterized protein n=1 Tax=Cylicocyclus nassatus TaxID=53992 RepID=A0AA36MBG0_CYLNA|nr:unnamed protein product [Cylicocyclus nassatus]
MINLHFWSLISSGSRADQPQNDELVVMGLKSLSSLEATVGVYEETVSCVTVPKVTLTFLALETIYYYREHEIRASPIAGLYQHLRGNETMPFKQVITIVHTLDSSELGRCLLAERVGT